MKTKFGTVMPGLLSRLRAKLVTFIHLKTEFHCSYFLALFTNVKAKRHFKVTMCEHLGILVLTGKKVKCDDSSTIKKHPCIKKHLVLVEMFEELK